MNCNVCIPLDGWRKPPGELMAREPLARGIPHAGSCSYKSEHKYLTPNNSGYQGTFSLCGIGHNRRELLKEQKSFNDDYNGFLLFPLTCLADHSVSCCSAEIENNCGCLRSSYCP